MAQEQDQIEQEAPVEEQIVDSGDGGTTPPAGDGVTEEDKGGSRYQARIGELVAQRKLAEERVKWEAERRKDLEERLLAQQALQVPQQATAPSPEDDPEGYVKHRLEQERQARLSLEKKVAQLEHRTGRGQALAGVTQTLDFGPFKAVAEKMLRQAYDLDPKVNLQEEGLRLYQDLGLSAQPQKKTPAKTPEEQKAYNAAKAKDAAATREPKPATGAPSPPATRGAAPPAKTKTKAELQAELRRDMHAALAAQTTGGGGG
jgi:hypothetical protein